MAVVGAGFWQGEREGGDPPLAIAANIKWARQRAEQSYPGSRDGRSSLMRRLLCLSLKLSPFISRI
jgi:hypothetical protein